MSEDRNHYGVAWAYADPDRTPSRSLARQLERALEKSFWARASQASQQTQIRGMDSFWRQGRQVAQSIRWEAEGAPLTLRSSSSRVVGQWSVGEKTGRLEPLDSALPWPTVEFSGMVSSSALLERVSAGPSSSVALKRWSEEFCSMDPSPPWVHWALWADLDMLRQELSQVSWDEDSLARWWELMASLVEPQHRIRGHYDIAMNDEDLSVNKLPISNWETRRLVIRTLCDYLPAQHRRPGRLAGLDKMRGSSLPGQDEDLVDEVLRGWLSPSRFWSLRCKLNKSRLVVALPATLLADFRALPEPAAHRALSKMTRTPLVLAGKLEGLPPLHDHAPNWSGWKPLLSSLDRQDLLAPPSQAFLATLSAADLDRKLTEAEAKPEPARPRL